MSAVVIPPHPQQQLHTTNRPQVLADLGKTSSDFRQLTTKALDQLCGGLMPRLRPVLDDAAAAPYELGESDLGAPSPWPQALLLAFQAHLGWLQPLLTPSGHDALVHLVLDKVRALGAGRVSGRAVGSGGVHVGSWGGLRHSRQLCCKHAFPVQLPHMPCLNSPRLPCLRWWRDWRRC